MKDQTVIHYNTIFSLFIVIALLGITTLATLAFINDGLTIGLDTYDLLFFSIGGIGGFGLAIYFLIVYLIPAIKKQSAVVINIDCICDNMKHITIRWDNVKDVGRFGSRYSNFILIYLNDPKEITGLTNNSFKKLMYLYNKLVYGTPIVISTQFLSGNDYEILALFLPFLNTQTQVTT